MSVKKKPRKRVARKPRKAVMTIVLSDGTPPKIVGRSEFAGEDGKHAYETWDAGTMKLEFTYVSPEAVGHCLDFIEEVDPGMKDSVDACRAVLEDPGIGKAELGRRFGKVSSKSADKKKIRSAHTMAGGRLMEPFKNKKGFPLVWKPPTDGRGKGASKSEEAPAAVSVYEAVKALERRAQGIHDPVVRAKVFELIKGIEVNLPK